MNHLLTIIVVQSEEADTPQIHRLLSDISDIISHCRRGCINVYTFVGQYANIKTAMCLATSIPDVGKYICMFTPDLRPIPETIYSIIDYISTHMTDLPDMISINVGRGPLPTTHHCAIGTDLGPDCGSYIPLCPVRSTVISKCICTIEWIKPLIDLIQSSSEKSKLIFSEPYTSEPGAISTRLQSHVRSAMRVVFVNGKLGATSTDIYL